jgi:adenylyltransferase/sulfurtransferase
VTLDLREVKRYGRQMVMPEVGREGQERLKAGRVLLVGAGGLGSPAALYLAAAGVGRLGIVEFDRIEATNLHRQILYGESDLGRAKLEVARERLAETNPHVEIVPVDARFDASNALEILADYDLVVDGSDNFSTRYLVNDACVLSGKPDVFGSVLRFEGQVSVFAAPGGPCYRCLFPEPPPPGMVPSCAEGGVLGVLPGIIGSLQALEAIKLMLGVGDPLVGRVLIFDGGALSFREISLARSPDCPICSPGAPLTTLVQYEDGCAPPDLETAPSAEAVPFAISPSEVELWRRQRRPFDFVDVRTPREFEISRVEGTVLLPLHELPARFAELDRSADLVVMCHHGIRSAQAVHFLRQQGFERARNLSGGIAAWSRDVDSSVPEY